jgi:pimeloyl-ACP methyl ester carboxylesterase
MEDYELNGFLIAARERRTAVDLVLVDAHYGYYANRTILDRLREDVIDPATRRGYDEIWLVGISLGGLGALLYASRNPGHITGLVLLAPFLGPPDVIGEIARAGGLKAWNPEGGAELVGNQDYQRPLWRWLKEQAVSQSGMAASPPVIHLAYGEQDRFAPGHQLLAEVLPAGRVLSVSGGHDWTTWTRLWQALLTSPESGFLR